MLCSVRPFFFLVSWLLFTASVGTFSAMLPREHQEFIEQALPVFQKDARILGVAAAGSWITKTMDQYSDIDLIAVVEPGSYEKVMAERQAIVAGLGKLLVAFTAEHVGEPRLLICLYDDPVLHVDVKFVSLPDLAKRIENPVVLWERDGALSKQIQQSEPKHPMPDLQWIEDRFWVWIHYCALRLGRGELFEVIDMLSYMRGVVLGPLALVSHGQLPRGVRRLELLTKPDVPAFQKTVATYDRGSCVAAINACIDLYQQLRGRAMAQTKIVLRESAEIASIRYLDQVSLTNTPTQ